jgi:competence protein ComEC
MTDPDWGEVIRPAREGTISKRAAAMLSRTLESESDRWILWVHVCLGTGAGLYFAAFTEPSIVTVLAALAVAFGLFVLLRRRQLGAVLASGLLFVAIGYGDAKLRTAYVASPMLAKATGLVDVRGWVERTELRSPKRYRLTLRVISIGGLDQEQTPYRVRMTVSGAHMLPQAGSAIRIRGRLLPIPEPVEPSAFDFARKAWFDRLGALGYAIGPPVPDAAAPTPPLDLRLRAGVDNLRQAVGNRIRQALPGQAGALATALITGDRGAIKQSTLEALRHSGLAHVLAISGLHMAMIAGAFYWLIRPS